VTVRDKPWAICDRMLPGFMRDTGTASSNVPTSVAWNGLPRDVILLSRASRRVSRRRLEVWRLTVRWL
jgi:hypothetical protein